MTTPGIGIPAADLPKGLAFDIADLFHIQDWASLHGVRMTIYLDHAVEDDEYEEVIAFYAGTHPHLLAFMYRNDSAVFVQPLIGRKLSYASVSKALESMVPQNPVRCTYLKARR